jgi:two-component system, LytTR family, sensor kinase
MSKKTLYWVCQLLGWVALLTVEFLISTIQYSFNAADGALLLAYVILCVLLTHSYRIILKKQNWVSLPLYRLIPLVVFSSMILGLIMTVFSTDDWAAILNDTGTLLLMFDGWLNWTKNMMMWTLGYTFYHYFEHIKSVEIEKILLKTSINESEAKILRSQLNPHFVFNALNSIRALISENPANAQQSVTQLSNILRNSLLADRRKTVELREEIKTVEDYLALEKIRYEDRLTSDFHIDPQTVYLQMPPMMLQTLVENAIKHGVQKESKGGFVQITTFLENNYVHIHIRNTGNLGDKEASGGFGLKNTARRLELLYGNDSLFRIFQESEAVVRAEIIVPIQTEGIFKKETVFSANIFL